MDPENLQPPAPSLTQAQVIKESPGPSWLTIILLFITLVSITGCVFLYIYYHQPNEDKISLTNSKLSTYGRYYIYRVKVLSTRNSDEGLIIETDSTDKNLPPFVVTRNTAILVSKNGEDLPARTGVIQPGVVAFISISHNIVKNNWFTTRVIVLDESTDTSVPNSASSAGVN